MRYTLGLFSPPFSNFAYKKAGTEYRVIFW
jgi:hypothetical protein